MHRILVATCLVFNLALLFIAERSRAGLGWTAGADSYAILFVSALLLVWPWLLAFMKAGGETKAQSLTFSILTTLLALFLFKPIAEQPGDTAGFVTLAYFLYCWVIYWMLAVFFFFVRIMSEPKKTVEAPAPTPVDLLSFNDHAGKHKG